MTVGTVTLDQLSSVLSIVLAIVYAPDLFDLRTEGHDGRLKVMCDVERLSANCSQLVRPDQPQLMKPVAPTSTAGRLAKVSVVVS